MRRSSWTPSIVPGAMIRLSMISVGDYEGTDPELSSRTCFLASTTIAFGSSLSTQQLWSEDVSEDVAFEIRRHCDLQMNDVPSSIQDFVDRREAREFVEL